MTDGNGTEWEWRTYPKGKRVRQGGASTPSIVVSPGGTFRYNKAAVQVILDDDSATHEDMTYVRYMVPDSDDPIVGFKPTDEDDPNGYSVVSETTSSAQSLLTAFGFDKPDDSVMMELRTDKGSVPYVDLSPLQEGDDAE